MSEQNRNRSNKLFSAADDWWHNACLNFTRDPAWGGYAEGYKEAADIIVKSVKDDRRHIDMLVFPIVFLYRQHIELRLKGLIQQAQALLDKPQDFPRTHNLSTLWEQCRSLVEEALPQFEVDEFQQIQPCIDDFCVVDPGSDSFRYPVDRNGNDSLPNIVYINLRKIEETVTEVAGSLEAISLTLTQYIDLKNELDRYYHE
jgi:hypothetical protein